MWGPYNVFFNFPNVGKEVVRQKLVFLLSFKSVSMVLVKWKVIFLSFCSRYFSIIRASSCELVKSSTNENSDNIFCLFPPRGCRVSLITEQLSFTHHILLFVSSKRKGYWRWEKNHEFVRYAHLIVLLTPNLPRLFQQPCANWKSLPSCFPRQIALYSLCWVSSTSPFLVALLGELSKTF